MNFSSRDMGIIVSMSLAIVAISFVFPALGLTGDEASDPPEFDISEDRFDFTGEFPSNPGTPSQGTLEWRDDLEGMSDNQRWLEGDTESGAELFASINASTGEPRVRFNLWDTGDTPNNDTVTTSTEGTTYRFSEGDWIIDVEFTSITELDDGYDFDVEYTVRERPESEGGWIGSIPLVGTLFGAGSAVASVIAWGFSVIWWGITWVFELTGNLLGMLFDVSAFVIGLLAWLSGTYVGVISGASSWASIFVAIPGIILSLLLGKLVMIGISLLPTT